jgi:hypothetical protein
MGLLMGVSRSLECGWPSFRASRISLPAQAVLLQATMSTRMPDAIDTPEHWRKSAEETRTLVGTISDPNTKRAMLGIAESYEMLARDAEERAQLGEKQPGQG